MKQLLRLGTVPSVPRRLCSAACQPKMQDAILAPRFLRQFTSCESFVKATVTHQAVTLVANGGGIVPLHQLSMVDSLSGARKTCRSTFIVHIILPYVLLLWARFETTLETSSRDKQLVGLVAHRYFR